jgi:adenylate cyclase
LDFTAIGPTVNLASRMLDEVSRRNGLTICSREFKAVAIGLTADPVECSFRGFDHSVEVFVLQ